MLSDSDSGSQRFYGKYRGVVENNLDPKKKGRLQIKVPAVMGEEVIWALPCVPYAGDGVGFYAMPAKGTGIWVEFEAGDPSYPIWVGCFWGDGQISSEDAQPHVKFLKTDQVTLRIDDVKGELLIENAGGSSFKIDPLEIHSKATTCSQEAGTKKTALTPVHFDVHDGAFTVV